MPSSSDEPREEAGAREPRPASLRVILCWSVLVGAGGGLIGFCYLSALHALEHVLGPEVHASLPHLLVLVGVGAAIGVLTRILGPLGDIELLFDNVHVLGPRKAELRHLRSLLPVSLLCIAAGGGAGPEAPLVQTTGTAARSLAERLGLSSIDRRTLTIAGMASAFTVLFGAPIGAALFALEILHRKGLQYHEALLPSVVAALVGYGVYVVASGLGLTPVWHITLDSEPHPIDLGWAAAAGVAGALIAFAFKAAVDGAQALFRPVPARWRPAAGGLVLGCLAFASPYALTYGKYQLDPLLATEAVAPGMFLIAALAKFAGTTTTLASGWRGGFIIPLFFIGAALAHEAHFLVPEANRAVLVCALMAAINTGVTKTPLGSTLVVSKMVGLSLVPFTALASVVALLLTQRTSFFASQRERSDERDRSSTSGG